MADWVLGVTADRADAEYRLIHLIAFDLPVFSDAALPAKMGKKYADERVQRFSDELDACDGNVFITAEYNPGIPGAFKNAIDHVGPELFGKQLAFVSYGAAGGVRAVEQWRQVAASTLFDSTIRCRCRPSPSSTARRSPRRSAARARWRSCSRPWCRSRRGCPPDPPR